MLNACDYASSLSFLTWVVDGVHIRNRLAVLRKVLADAACVVVAFEWRCLLAFAHDHTRQPQLLS